MSTFERVVKVLVDAKDCDEAAVKMESTWAELELDSLDTVELIMEFEKAFEITIPDDKAEKISTVADAIAFIEANK